MNHDNIYIYIIIIVNLTIMEPFYLKKISHYLDYNNALKIKLKTSSANLIQTKYGFNSFKIEFNRNLI